MEKISKEMQEQSKQLDDLIDRMGKVNQEISKSRENSLSITKSMAFHVLVSAILLLIIFLYKTID